MATRRSTRLRHRVPNGCGAEENDEEDELDVWLKRRLDVQRREREEHHHHFVVARAPFVFCVLFLKGLTTSFQSQIAPLDTSPQQRVFLTVSHLLVAPFLGLAVDMGHVWHTLALVLASSLFSNWACLLPKWVWISPFLAIFSHVILACQMNLCAGAISDQNRLSRISLVGFVYGLGTKLGPLALQHGASSTFLARMSASLLVAYLPLIIDCLCLLALPFMHQVVKPNYSKTFALRKKARMSRLLLLKTLLTFPLSLLQILLPQMAKERFFVSESLHRQLLQIITTCSLFLQGIVIPCLSSWISLRKSFGLACLVMALTFFMMTLTSSAQELFLVLLPLSLAATFAQVIFTAMTALSSKELFGFTVGTSLAIHHATRTISSLWASDIMDAIGLFGMGFLGVSANFIAVAISNTWDD